MRAVWFLCNAAAVNDKIMKSKTIASKKGLILLDIKIRRRDLTEEENSVKEPRARLYNNTSMNLRAPFCDNDDHCPIEKSPMC